MKQQGYTVGFVIDDHGNVLLLRKAKPQWQKGLLNGIGGKIEEGETPFECMVREANEEAGIDSRDWEYVITMEGTELDPEKDWQVHIYKLHVPDLGAMDIPECSDVGETLEIRFVDCIPADVVPNLRWIIPLCRDRGFTLERVS